MRRVKDRDVWIELGDEWPECYWAELDRELEANGLWARRQGSLLFVPNVVDDVRIHMALNPDRVMAELLEAMGEK